jgi:hypothetical protein
MNGFHSTPTIFVPLNGGHLHQDECNFRPLGKQHTGQYRILRLISKFYFS